MNRPTAWLPLPVAAALLAALVGCGEQNAAVADPDGDPDGQRYQVSATVLEASETGPQLCHAVADSLPPQCTGPEVVGWDWAAVEAESAGGTTWGSYLLTGTWDGARFTLTEPAQPDGGSQQPGEPDQPDFTSPCPEPAGGWRPVDPATATQAGLDAALALAAEDPGYAGGWVDQSYLDQAGQPDPDDLEQAANDPTKLVLNLRFTGDQQAREEPVRQVWGGALCLTGAEHTEAELLDIQQRVHEDFPGLVFGSGPDPVANTLSVQLFVATEELQAELDQRYGDGTVTLDGWLRPVT